MSKNYESYDELLKDYGEYCGVQSLLSLGKKDHEKRNYIVTPLNFIDLLQECAEEMPPYNVATEFMNLFYSVNETFLILSDYYEH